MMFETPARCLCHTSLGCPEHDGENVDTLPTEFTDDECCCHLLPETDMNGGQFLGVCNFCEAYNEDVTGAAEAYFESTHS